MNLKTAILPLLGAAMMCSCSDNDDNNNNIASARISSANNVVVVTSKSTGDITPLNGANYYLVVDRNTNNVSITINDLQYRPDATSISFSMPEAKMSLSQQGLVLDRPESLTVSTVDGSATISNFYLRFNLRTDSSLNLVALSFTLDGEYDIDVVFTPSAYIGTTSSVDITDPTDNPFSTTVSQYQVILTPSADDPATYLAQINIAYPKFRDDMPSSIGTMVFAGIPVTFTSDGFSFSSPSVIPTIGSDPYPQFAITAISGSIKNGSTLILNFDCRAFNRKVTVDANIY